MTKKVKTTILITTILVVIGFVSFFILHEKNREKNNDLLLLQLVTIKTASGWGYKILVDHKVFIRQEFIPVISGFKSFTTEQQALAMGNLVLNKIKKKQLPSVTHADLRELNIDTLP